MEYAGSICDSYLRQSPACNWIISPAHRFERVYGNSLPVFGTSAGALEGRTIVEALPADAAKLWSERIARVIAGERLLLRERQDGAAWYIVLFPLRKPAEATAYAAGFALDVTPWSTAEHELRHTVLGALRAQEFERQTMSRFLHDTVGQNLSAAGLQLDLIRMDLEQSAPDVCTRIVEIQQGLESMMERVREYSYELNPSMVERAGLHAALDRLTGRYRRRYTGAIRLIFDPSTKVPARYATAFYQVAQEAVENAVQHSGCSVIEIAVKSTKNGPHLEVRDNGRGFDPADVLGCRRGLGLLTMEHFAAQAGLDVSISSSRESGTVVHLGVPEARNQ